MIKVYDFLDLIPDVVEHCDELYGYTYDELKEVYVNTVLLNISAQRLVDIVEDAIRCADKTSKLATVKRLSLRTKTALFEIKRYDTDIDFRSIDAESNESRFDLLFEIRSTLEEFCSLMRILCLDYKITKVSHP